MPVDRRKANTIGKLVREDQFTELIGHNVG